MIYNIVKQFFWAYFLLAPSLFKKCKHKHFIECYNYCNLNISKRFNVTKNLLLLFNNNFFSKMFRHKKLIYLALYLKFFIQHIDNIFVGEFLELIGKKVIVKNLIRHNKFWLRWNVQEKYNFLHELDFVREQAFLVFFKLIKLLNKKKNYIKNIILKKSLLFRTLLEQNTIVVSSITSIYSHFQIFINKILYYLYITLIEKNIYFILYKKNNNIFIIMKQWCLGFLYHQKTLDIYDEGFNKIIAFIKMFCEINIIHISWIYINIFFLFISLEKFLVTKILSFFSDKNFDFIYFCKKIAHNGCRLKKKKRVKRTSTLQL